MVTSPAWATVGAIGSTSTSAIASMQLIAHKGRIYFQIDTGELLSFQHM